MSESQDGDQADDAEMTPEEVARAQHYARVGYIVGTMRNIEILASYPENCDDADAPCPGCTAAGRAAGWLSEKLKAECSDWGLDLDEGVPPGTSIQ